MQRKEKQLKRKVTEQQMSSWRVYENRQGKSIKALAGRGSSHCKITILTLKRVGLLDRSYQRSTIYFLPLAKMASLSFDPLSTQQSSLGWTLIQLLEHGGCQNKHCMSRPSRQLESERVSMRRLRVKSRRRSLWLMRVSNQRIEKWPTLPKATTLMAFKKRSCEPEIEK